MGRTACLGEMWCKWLSPETYEIEHVDTRGMSARSLFQNVGKNVLSSHHRPPSKAAGRIPRRIPRGTTRCARRRFANTAQATIQIGANLGLLPFHISTQKAQNVLHYNQSSPFSNSSPRGYMIHEGGRWTDVHGKWLFMPRKLSRELYDEVLPLDH